MTFTSATFEAHHIAQKQLSRIPRLAKLTNLALE